MEYSEVRNIMFNSNEAACIPVSLEESVPFQCEVNGVPMNAFFYWDHKDSIKVKFFLGVSQLDGSIVFLDESGIISTLGIDDLTFDAPEITDVNAYYEDKDRYTEKFAQICIDPTLISELGGEMFELLKNVTGNGIIQNLLCIVAEFFMKIIIKKWMESKNKEQTNNEENTDVQEENTDNVEYETNESDEILE